MCEPATHEHQLVTHLYHVKVPYLMKPQEIQLEVAAKLQDLPTLLADLAEYKDDEVRRIFAGTAILMEKYPHRTVEDCLDTAMVWERG